MVILLKLIMLLKLAYPFIMKGLHGHGGVFGNNSSSLACGSTMWNTGGSVFGGSPYFGGGGFGGGVFPRWFWWSLSLVVELCRWRSLPWWLELLAVAECFPVAGGGFVGGGPFGGGAFGGAFPGGGVFPGGGAFGAMPGGMGGFVAGGGFVGGGAFGMMPGGGVLWLVWAAELLVE